MLHGLAALGPFAVALRGFTAQDNPDAQVGAIVGGHDFAVVEDRWIVDPWAVHFDPESQASRYVHDRHDPGHAAEIRRLYGDPAHWSSVDAFDQPHTRPWDDYEDEEVLRGARQARPGAVREAARRHLWSLSHGSRTRPGHARRRASR